MPRFDLEDIYLGLDGRGEVTQMPGGEAFWRTMGDNPLMRPTLIAVSADDGDWPHWEMHPEGDEVLVALQGSGMLIFERSDGEEHIAIAAGRTVIVPAGVWHRAIDQRALKMLFITYGPGTTHKPITA